jgi:hypothetical protein
MRDKKKPERTDMDTRAIIINNKCYTTTKKGGGKAYRT